MTERHDLARALRDLDQMAAQAGTEASRSGLDATRMALDELAAENARLRDECERARQMEARFRDLFDATYDGIFLVDIEQGRVLEANEPACRMVGYSLEELRELTISELHPYELPRFLEFAQEVTRHGKWQTHELTCRAKWGELIPAELSATAVVYDSRRCILVLAHDMREHRLAKLGLAVSKIGHDLRNILATTQLLADHLSLSPDPESRRVAPRLIDSIDRAIRLCTDTLKHGRASLPEPRSTRFELSPLLEDVAATAGLRNAVKGSGVWRNDVPPGFSLHADPDQLFRALLNLVRNARQAVESSGQGEIRASAARDGKGVQIDVADTGPGLPPAARERLFQPFASAGREGTGLGLLIAREITQGHGGDLLLVKSDASGTTFRLELPSS